MRKYSTTLAVAGLVLAGSAASANAASLAAATYASIGMVTASNGANCGQIGLTQGASSNSFVNYPGATKTGLTIYTPGPGNLQLCTGFPAVPAGGLNGFNASANCGIYTVNGNAPPALVAFNFTSTVIDAKSAVGTTTVAIPVTAVLGAGCTATITNTIVRTGK